MRSLYGREPCVCSVSVSMVMSVLVLAVGCGDMRARRPGPRRRQDDSAGPLTVYVVNYPLQYFAERIGGEHVEVVFPAPGPDRDVDSRIRHAGELAWWMSSTS